jgi:hypothetical protein
LQTAINGLWDPATGAYDWAVHSDGAHQQTTWSALYPDALEQVWAVAFGAVPQSRAAALLTRFSAAHPLWANPVAMDLVAGSESLIGYWPITGWALDRVGDRADATTAWASIRGVAGARLWPFTPASAGQLIALIDPGPPPGS